MSENVSKGSESGGLTPGGLARCLELEAPPDLDFLEEEDPDVDFPLPEPPARSTVPIEGDGDGVQ